MRIPWVRTCHSSSYSGQRRAQNRWTRWTSQTRSSLASKNTLKVSTARETFKYLTICCPKRSRLSRLMELLRAYCRSSPPSRTHTSR